MKLTDHLRKIGAEACFQRMGLSLEELFEPSPSEDPYRGHRWVLKENDQFLIVNAIPPVEQQDRLFWEEWYLHRGRVCHHILSLWRPPAYDEVFEAPARDEIHPEECFGRRWYVIDEKDMRPLLLRR